MKTDAVKDFAIHACQNWLTLEIPDIEDRLPVGLTLAKWHYDDVSDTAYLNFDALPGHNFEIWAHKNWRWDGRFEIHVSWLPPDMSRSELKKVKARLANVTYKKDYEILKKPGEQPWVLDKKEGELWMQASKTPQAGFDEEYSVKPKGH